VKVGGLTINVDLNPLKMVYVVNRPVSEQSLILSCFWNLPPVLVKMIIQYKTDDGRWLEFNQHDRISIQYWKLENTFNGIELRFSESAAGSFSLCRCAGWIPNFRTEIYGPEFVLTIEGTYTNDPINNSSNK